MGLCVVLCVQVCECGCVYESVHVVACTGLGVWCVCGSVCSCVCGSLCEVMFTGL